MSLISYQATVSSEQEVFQFHALTDARRPNLFYFFEIFQDEKALADHVETEHWKTWWNNVKHMVNGEPHRISTMETVFPSSQGLEKQKAGLLDW